ncbi:MAG TPA: GxxExxY protein [Acetobacteraceae bacterium]|nr:GxxExxY protein [Acetobacteraceae bacterium]
MAQDMRAAGLAVAQERGITVFCNGLCSGVAVGGHVADLAVEAAVVVALSASKALDPAHTAQCINYLQATRLRRCLLLNVARLSLEIHLITHEL